jgi:hypothetical protein
MILKIRRYDNNQKWWILDDIRKISISEPIITGKYPIIEENPDILIFDTKSMCDCDGIENQCSDCKRHIILICRLSNGEEFSVIFDTIAFLLNDNGKTVEKIVANY